jgi:hypothetical protein
MATSISKEEKDEFSKAIMKIAANSGITHLEAVIEHCERSSMEPEVAALLCNDTLKSLLAGNASELNYIKKISTLPV